MEGFRCNACSRRSVFISKPKEDTLKEVCECVVSEEKSLKILGDTIRGFRHSFSSTESSVFGILSLVSKGMYADDFILGRDKNIEAMTMAALKYIFGEKKLDKWEYLDIGCGTFIPTLKIAKELGTYPWGIDYIDRRKCNPDQLYFGIFKDKIPSYGDLSLVTMCDILHHTQDPEMLLSNVVETILGGGYIFIIDVDCECWEDSYYLDLVHLVYAKGVGESSGDFLPVHGYRSRKYWRRFMTEKGMKLVYHNTGLGTYKEYIDVYKKSE